MICLKSHTRLSLLLIALAMGARGSKCNGEIVNTTTGLAVVRIVQPVEGATFAPGVGVEFVGQATDTAGTTLTGEQLVWTSSVDATIGSGTQFSTTVLSLGLHQISLTATNDQGEVGSDTISLTIGTANESPTAVLRANPTAGEAPLLVSFDATGSYDFDDGIAAYDWDFGDGNTDTDALVDHTFSTSGNYTVTLTVTDASAAADTAQVTIAVSTPGNVPPTADIVASPGSGDAPLLVSFDGSGSSDSDGSVVAWAWDFGDGANGTGETTSHTYDDGGNFTVTLTVTDDGNGQDTATTTIGVTEQGNQFPEATFTATPRTGPAPLSVSFDASTSADPDGSIVSYEWSFGDGGTGTGVSPVHSFTAPGVYVTELWVADDEGATDLATDTIVAQNAGGGGILVDHTSLPLFDSIPTQYITAAAQIRSLYIHASVGGTIQDGLRCIAGELDSRPFCAGVSDPQYDYSNWTWLPHASGGCEGKLQDLTDAAASQPDYDVYHQKYCYFEGLDDIGCCTNFDQCVAGCPGQANPAQCEADCEQAFQESLQDFLDLYTGTMNSLESTYPTKVFVWWTIPYAIGDDRCANEFNQGLRQYAVASDKILYDIADIEAYDHLGQHVLTGNGNHESVHPYYCGEFKSNPDAASCHPDFAYDLNYDSDSDIEPECGEGGKLRLAKAWWVLFAQLGGWAP